MMKLTRRTKQMNPPQARRGDGGPAESPAGDTIEQKLSQLLLFVDQLNHTPHGRDEIERRVRRYGECKRAEGETSNQFYARLRNWLDKTCD